MLAPLQTTHRTVHTAMHSCRNLFYVMLWGYSGMQESIALYSAQRDRRTEIHLCRKVLPQPKLRERSLPVPRGMTATAGGGSSCRSMMVVRIHATVPSPPAASMRNRLQQTHTCAAGISPLVWKVGLKVANGWILPCRRAVLHATNRDLRCPLCTYTMRCRAAFDAL